MKSISGMRRLFLRQYRFLLVLLVVITILLTFIVTVTREEIHKSDSRIAGITEQMRDESSRRVGEIADQMKDESRIYVDSQKADEMYRNVTVLCFILTMEKNMDNRAAVVNATWAKRCNKVLYILCTDRKSHDILSTCFVRESKEHLTGKVRYTLKYIYKHYLHKYDWFLKADDDTYVVMENLRYLLSHYPTDKAGYLGYHFKLFVMQGYMSGGAGYVINKQALKQVVERGFSQNHCREDGGDEDVEMGKCLEASNVSVFSSLDKFQRETFHTDTAWQHTLGKQPGYLDRYSHNGVHKGTECCSQFPVTYHHLDEDGILFLEHMLYRTHVWGRHGRTDVKDLFLPKVVRPVNKHLLQSDEVDTMLEPPPYSPHPGGTSVVTTSNDTCPPPEYHSAISQGLQLSPINAVHLTTQNYPSEINQGIHVVSTDPLPTLPDYEREAGSDSPPSYESLFGRVKAAQQSSNSSFALCKTLCGVFLSSAFCLIFMAILSALPISQIVMGVIYMDDCPVAKYVPVYLVVMGVVCLVKFLSILGQNLHNRQNEGEDAHIKRTNGFDQVLNVFLLVWFILGNRWVYGIHSYWTSDPESKHYCHPTIYYFAYWTITSFYIFCGAVCVFMCILSCLCGHNRGQS